MLSENVLVSARKAYESLYTGVCDIITYGKVLRENKTTGMAERVLVADEPCRISFSSFPTVDAQANLATRQAQNVKLFINPDIEIPPGSKVVVTQDGLTVEYSASSERAHYPTHQEINLSLFKGWT